MNNTLLIVLLPIILIAVELVIIRIPVIQQSAIGYFYALLLGLSFLFGLTSPIFLLISFVKKQKVELAVKYGFSILIVFSIFFLFRGALASYIPIPLPQGSNTMSFNRELWIKNDLFS